MEDLIDLASVAEIGWGLEIFAVVTATLILRIAAVWLLDLIARQFSRTGIVWDDALFAAARAPLGWLILILGLIMAIDLSEAYVDFALFSDDNLNILRQLTLVGLLVVFLWRFITQLENRLRERIEAESRGEGRLDPTTLNALAKLLRLSVIITGVLIALPTMGIEITALLAFGGIGGIAVGFAAQDLLSNLFGGLMIYLDKPFKLGDWIRSPDREIEGTVEYIGWRLTVVRTFDKRPLYIPNSLFTKLALENPSRMLNRRINEKIGLRYQDWQEMAGVVGDVKDMLRQHADIDTSQTLIVNFNGYGDSSINFFIYCFTKTTNWVEFHEIKQDVLLRIMNIVNEHGAEFAFPTMTLDGLDETRPEPDPGVGEQSGAAASGAA